MTYAYKLMNSPVGELKLVANGNRLAAMLWENGAPRRAPLSTVAWETRPSCLIGHHAPQQHPARRADLLAKS